MDIKIRQIASRLAGISLEITDKRKILSLREAACRILHTILHDASSNEEKLTEMFSGMTFSLVHCLIVREHPYFGTDF